MRKLAFAIAAALFILAGCQSTPGGPEQPQAPVEERGARGADAAAGRIDQPPVAEVRPGAGDGDAGIAALKDPKSILSRRSVYFDYDSVVIKAEFKPLIEAHARFLVANQKMKMLIQGNTDERGSREYNLALGQKRADAVKNMLVLLGVREERIETVSLGEEKPKDAGHDEAAWAMNRRSDMLYSGEF